VPLLTVAPSFETRLATLTQAARHDLSCACGPATPRRRSADGLWLYPTALPSGERVPMLKVLQASGCERGCLYCVERLGGQSPAVTLLPDELARVYYSSLQPVAGTALEDQPPVPFMREHRLYQVDFLLRSYGFALEEISFDDQGGVFRLELDPKSAWARSHPERFPFEINTAPVSELLRVPGVGPKSAGRIAGVRRKERLRYVEALGALGVSWRIAAPFVLLDGKPAIRQLSLL